MSKSRRFAVIVALATAAVGMAAVTSTAPAVAAPQGGPQPVSSWLRAIKAHSDSWINISWRTNYPVCDVQVRASGRRVDVRYPGGRHSATLSRGNLLRPGRTDFTAISVDPDFTHSGIAALKTVISFNDCSAHAHTQHKSFTLVLPVLHNNNWPGHDAPGQPNPGQPHPSQPNPSQPNPSQPNPSQPNPSQPNPGQSGPVQASQPASGQPSASQPGPGHGQPNPSPSQPGQGQPNPSQLGHSHAPGGDAPLPSASAGSNHLGGGTGPVSKH